MQNIVEDPQLRNREYVFTDRENAGRRLGELMQDRTPPDGLLFAIPSGGVPVAIAMQPFLQWPLELLLVRKVQVPQNTEAGFGAVNMDGERFFNERLLHALQLLPEVIESQVQKALRTIHQRNTLFRCDDPFPDIAGKDIVIVDDGLASGYTMMAAIHFVKNRKPGSVTVAVPTGTADTVKKTAREVDRLYCLNIREAYPFAVANAYMNWYDLSDKEVLNLLGRNPCL
ncbi:MAG: phosphoribosyltransferase family protein [Desulfobulbaceae bacterium]|nr:phosphoribosyltransferase family protein [Desulfobulbaceae bacterium]